MTKGLTDRFPSIVGRSVHLQGAVGGYSAVSAFSVVLPVKSGANPLSGTADKEDDLEAGLVLPIGSKGETGGVDCGSSSESDDYISTPELDALCFAKLMGNRKCNYNLPGYLFPPGTTDRTQFPPVQVDPSDLIPSVDGLFRFVFPNSFGTLASQNPSEMIVTRGSVLSPPSLVFPSGGTIKVSPGGYIAVRDLLYPGYSIPVSQSGCTVVVPVGGSVTFSDNLDDFNAANVINSDDDVEILANFESGDATGGRFLNRY